jgi:hypothetical protein
MSPAMMASRSVSAACASVLRFWTFLMLKDDSGCMVLTVNGWVADCRTSGEPVRFIRS